MEKREKIDVAKITADNPSLDRITISVEWVADNYDEENSGWRLTASNGEEIHPSPRPYDSAKYLDDAREDCIAMWGGCRGWELEILV